MSPPWKGRETFCFPLASVRLSVYPSVCMAVRHKTMSALYNLKTIRDILTKLHTFVKQIQTTMSNAQEP